MYSILFTTQYRRCRRLLIRRGYDMSKLDNTISVLASGEPVPPHYRDHRLKGSHRDDRECHVEGLDDWILIYRTDTARLTLLLTGTGTHTDLFECNRAQSGSPPLCALLFVIPLTRAPSA
jgi:mRNA interferase YafQ